MQSDDEPVLAVFKKQQQQLLLQSCTVPFSELWLFNNNQAVEDVLLV